MLNKKMFLLLYLLLFSPLFAAEKSAGSFNIFQWFSGAMSSRWIFISVIILASILFIATFVLKGKISIKLPGGTGFDIDSGSKEKAVSEKNPHSKCPYAIDFRHAFTKTIYVVSKVSEIKYRGRLQEQMGYVEEQLVSVRTMYQRSYLEKLKEKLKEKFETEDAYLYEDYRYYQAIIKLIIHDVESVIRASFNNDKILSYEIEDYQRYIDLKFNVIKALEIDFIDAMYIGDWVLSRDEIFDVHRKNREELQKVVTDIYVRARKIALSKKAEIETLEEELQEYMNSTVGNTIKIEKIPVAK